MPTHLVIAFACLACAVVALAAVPPLSKEQLTGESTLVVTGKIASIATSTKDRGEGMHDTIYHVKLAVDAVEKGDASLRGRTIEMTTWEPAKRPPGWAGHQGQNETPTEGAAVRCYLRASDESPTTYELLTPNGLEKLQPAAATAPAAPTPRP